jgi:hypothetical protein
MDGYARSRERGRKGSGERVAVSSCASLEMTSSGEVSSRPVVSSRMTEKSVGREGVVVAPSAVRRIYLRATLGFLLNMRIRAFP